MLMYDWLNASAKAEREWQRLCDAYLPIRVKRSIWRYSRNRNRDDLLRHDTVNDVNNQDLSMRRLLPLIVVFAAASSVLGAPKPRPTVPPGIGIMDLPDIYDSDPPLDPFTLQGLTNSHVKGIMWRETWDRLAKNGVHGALDWTYLDKCFSAADGYNKLMAIEILAGNFAPASFFYLPGAKYIITAATGLKTTVPFDPVFQTEWEAVQTALKNRYETDVRLKYVKMCGPGHGSESFFATDPTEWDACNTLAVSMGYTDCAAGWKAGVTWIINMYARVWDAKPFLLCTGIPYDDTHGGTTDLQAMFNYGDNTYRGRFGARADDLYSSTLPANGSLSATVIQQISPHLSATGFQMGTSISDVDIFNGALVHGTDLGAHFIEVFSGNANRSAYYPALDAANARMRVP